MELDNICPILAKSILENLLNTRFSHFRQFFWPKRGSYVIRFEFWGKIWNPLIILHIMSPHLILFSHFDFLTSHAFSKFSNCSRQGCFEHFEISIFHPKFWKRCSVSYAKTSGGWYNPPPLCRQGLRRDGFTVASSLTVVSVSSTIVPATRRLHFRSFTPLPSQRLNARCSL